MAQNKNDFPKLVLRNDFDLSEKKLFPKTLRLSKKIYCSPKKEPSCIRE